MNRLQLELYVLGNTLSAKTALANLTRACRSTVDGECDIVVIDVLEQPQAAEAANIVATPCLVRRSPPPHWRMIGDLSNTDVLCRGLEIECGAKTGEQDG